MSGASNYGGFWIRTLAYAVDMAILMAGLLLLAVALTFMGGAGTALFSLIAALGPIAYFVWLTASARQATFGKQLCGLKVRHAGSGERISLLRSIARELGKIVSAAVLMIGFLLIAFTGRKQGLHDMLASTEVVREGTARVGLALFVAIAGVVVPLVIIPLMFGALFAGLMMAMMGGTMEQSVKQSKPVPQIEQKAAPRPQSSATQPAPAPKAAAAVDDPETVYRKYHQATLDSDVEGMRKWLTKAKGDELAAMSAVERKMMFGLMNLGAPRTFRVSSPELGADGNKATLYVTAEQINKGKTETVRATVTLLKEGGAWKVDFENWGGDQPAGPAPGSAAAAAPAAAAPVKPAAIESPKPVAAPAPVARQAPPEPSAQPRPAPRRSEAAAARPTAPVMQKSKPPCVYKPVMTDEEIERCR